MALGWGIVDRASLREHAGFVLAVGAAVAVLGGGVLAYGALEVSGTKYRAASNGWVQAGVVLLLAGAALIVLSVVIYVWRRSGTASSASPPDPLHPSGVSIHARGLRNEEGAAILASGPGSFVDLVVSEEIVNSGVVSADQGGPGLRLADHARFVAGHITDHAAGWEQRAVDDGAASGFAPEYVRFGYGRQAGELYDSAVRAGLTTSMTRDEFQGAVTPGAARQIGAELVRWAGELDQRRSASA